MPDATLALAFTDTAFDDAQDVGDRLLRHPLTAAMFRVAAERPRNWDAAVAAMTADAPAWGKVHADQPAEAGSRARAVRRAHLSSPRPDRQRRTTPAVQR